MENDDEEEEGSEPSTHDLSIHGEMSMLEEETDNSMNGRSFKGMREHNSNDSFVFTFLLGHKEVPKVQKQQQEQQKQRSNVRLNSDEHFTLQDYLAREKIYLPLSSVPADRFADLTQIFAFNLTNEHFEPHATQWHHLKDGPLQLVCSIFNTLAFFTNKKQRASVAEKPTRPGFDGSSNKRPRPGQEEEDTAATAEPINRVAEEEVNNFMDGDRNVSLFIETLVTKDGRVGGIRVVVRHKAVAKEDKDMFSLALRESLLELNKVKDLAAKQITAITKTSNQKGGNGKSKGGAKQYAISKEYSYANHDTFESHFLTLVRPYFTRDSHLLVEDERVVGEEQESVLKKHHAERRFKDSRAFHQFDALKPKPNERDFTKIAHPCNLTHIFTKEAAMLYYVRAANIQDSQCQLESYCSTVKPTLANYTEENAHCHMDLDDIVAIQNDQNAKTPTPPLPDVAELAGASLDRHFVGFPHENITYYVDNRLVCAEFIVRMPLPHRIGSTLYTQHDLIKLKQRANLELTKEEKAHLSDLEHAARVAANEHIETEEMTGLFRGMGLESEDDADDMAENGYRAPNGANQATYGSVVRYLGIHDTEYEVTAEVMLAEPDHIDRVTLENLKSAIIPREIIAKFLTSKSNEIQARMKQILNNLGYKHRIVIRECASVNPEQRARQTAKRLEIREYPATGMDIVTHGYPVEDKDRAIISQLPYLASTLPGAVMNRNKRRAIERKAHEYLRRYAMEHATEDDASRELQREYEERDYDAKVASGYVGHFKDTITARRPWGNSLHVLKTQLRTMKLEEVYLGRDIFLRLEELNCEAYRNLDAQFYDPNTGLLPAERELEYYEERRKVRDAAFVEFWHEFFTSPNVSLACEGVRSDLLKQRLSYVPPSVGETAAQVHTDTVLGKKIIGLELPVYEYNQELRPYSAFRVEVRRLFHEEAGITFNYKIVETLYFAKFHHCRWYPECNDPKLNILLSGNGAAGKSKGLQEIKKTLPTAIGDMVTHITDQAFNVDRNLNDMLLIYEEFQNKYLGYSGGNSGGGSGSGGSNGNSAGSDKDTTNFFKARLTSGATSVMAWFENEETGLRDMKISKAHCQGSILGASNNDFTDADVNVMSRFILLSVPKSKNQIRGLRPQDRNKPTYGTDTTQSNEVYEMHREIHRVYFMCEQMIKSGVINESKYGVNVDSARIQIDFILDHMQKCYGIQTNDVRKRGHILELARCMALSFAVWYGLTSEETRPLFYDPHDPKKFIGFNPRVVLEGILPYMVVTKDMVFDAITCLSSLWIHEYQDTILEAFATKHCKLHQLKDGDFMRRVKNDVITGGSSRSLTHSRGGDFNASYGGGGGGGGRTNKEDCEVDYNYIVMKGKTRESMFHLLSISLGEMIVAANDIGKLFHEFSNMRLEACESYAMSEIPGEIDDETGFQGQSQFKLVKSPVRNVMDRYVVEFGVDPLSGKQTIGLLVHYIRQKLPGLFHHVVDDLNKKDSIVRSLEDIQRLEEEEDEMQNNEIEIDEDEECDANEKALFKEIRSVGTANDNTANLFVKAFRDVMENEVFEDYGGSKEYMQQLEQSHINPITKKVPWMTFITADSPKPRHITTFHPDLKASIDEAQIDTKPIYFVDQFLMMDLKRRKNGKKLVINNYNTISATTRASNSLYKQARERQEAREQELRKKRAREDEEEDNEEEDEYRSRRFVPLKKARISEYEKTAAFELDRDCDIIACQDHLRNIAYPGLWKKKSDTENHYATPNYPACMYMSIMERREAKALAVGEEPLPLLEYPFINIASRVAQEKEKLKGELDPASVQYPSFSRFMDSNLTENSRFRLCSSHGDDAAAGERVIGKPLKRSDAAERKNRYVLVKGFL